MGELPEHVAVNREFWDGMAHEWVEGGERAWEQAEPSWGEWGIPENELRMLPDDMTGMQAIELGCGTAYVSGWMARRGASVTGIDNSAEQLRTARRLAEQHGVALELIHGNAEAVPKPDESFDFAISEYGAAIWADPYRVDTRSAPPAAAGRDAGVPREPRFRGHVLAGRRVIPDHPPTRAALLRQPSPGLARRRR